jgi:penicillin-binding protein 1A
MTDPVDPSKKQKRGFRKRFFFLKLDALIDSGLWTAGQRAAEIWEDITIFSRRFEARGIWKVVFELSGEAMTLGTAGLVLLLALAQPAFEETKDDWRKRGDYAVTFLDRYGNPLGHRGVIHETSVPVDDLPDYFVKAVLATEDRRFFDHFGIDFFGLVRALSENARAGGVVQGGSTLTQQLAKNLFLTNERSLERKIKEAFLSMWLESHLTKKEILRLYLDRTYMGGGTFGAEAAAQFYFGKDVTEINLAEAAMLAGLFKAPTKYSPAVNLPAARARANEVLTNLVQSGFMTEGQVVAARRNPASVIDRSNIPPSPDYFLDWAFDEAKRLAGPNSSHTLIVKTTLDPGLQKAADESVGSTLMQYSENAHVAQGALVMIENGGAVRAMVGGRDYGESQFNRATRALRQPGSSFKIYTYALAMENGFTPESTISDAPIRWGNWQPKNYGRSYAGRVTLMTALAKSINTVPVRLAKESLGIKPIIKMAYAMGVETPLKDDVTIPIGTSEVTVMDQATAYAVFPADGYQSRRHGIVQISDESGKVVYDFAKDAPPAKRVLTEQALSSMNKILVTIPVNGTARRAALANGIVSGGKTGTTQNYRDAWYIGFSGNFTTAVWFGNDDYTPTNRITGGSLPAMTFKRLMDYAHQGIQLRPIPGIENPLPPNAGKPDGKSNAEEANGAMAPIERPRMLTPASTKLVESIGKALADAPPLVSVREASYASQ